MANLRIMSDIHLEFHNFTIPPLPNDKDSILILAGDIGLAYKPHTYIDFIDQAAKQFSHVIYICGNHEHYRSSFIKTVSLIQQEINQLNVTNVTFGDKFTHEIDDIAFVCATLWTDMNNQDPITMYMITQMINDFNLIRFGPEDDPYKFKLRPENVVSDFLKAKKYIFSQVEHLKQQNKKVVVVTHHLPSRKSILPQYINENISNGAFVTDLEKEILQTKPDLMVHGHTHGCLDYNISNTRVICNPRGYPGENPFFDANLEITV